MEQQVFEQFIALNQADIFRFLRYLGAEWHLAEDLTQETFICLFKEKEKCGLTPDSPETSKWLRVVAKNLFLMHLRKNKRKLVEFTDASFEKAEQVWQDEYRRDGDGGDVNNMLKKCLKKLPEKQQLVVDLFYQKSLSRENIAEKCGMKKDGVKTLLRRIREALAKCIRLGLNLEGEG